MAARFAVGDCVKVPDGRVGRVRARDENGYRVRLQRKTSKTHHFMTFRAGVLKRVQCPEGWMSPDGYRRYLKPTLAKLAKRQRRAKKGRKKSSSRR